MRRALGLLLFVSLAGLAACGPDDGRQLAEPDPDLTALPPPTTVGPVISGAEPPEQGIGPGGLTLSSPDFPAGGALPLTASCRGSTSPALQWTAPPAEVTELALVVQDIDAGNFAQWVVTGIPTTERQAPAGSAPRGGAVRPNSAGTIGWSSPCPDDDTAHRIVFTLYALDEPPAQTSADAPAVIRAVQAAAIGSASLLARAIPRGPDGN